MKNLLVILLEEMTKSGNVERFDSEVILPGGSISDAEIVRVGVFNAITEDYFQIYSRNPIIAGAC